MDSFSYTDNIRAAFASCLSCFARSQSPNSASNSNPSHPDGSRPTRPPSNDLEHLLRDTDSDALSLHSNFGTSHRRARRRRRPKFSLTLFGYTLFGRPPIYLSDDEDGDDGLGGRTRALATTSSSTLDSDAAPLDASTIERLSSPDHHAVVERERERQRFEEEEQARRKAERRARRHERKARERASALMALTGLAEGEAFEGFQGSESCLPPHPQELVRTEMMNGEGSNSGDADDADLGGELYARKKKQSAVRSGSGSDSRSRTSASFSAGDAPRTRNSIQFASHSIPYPHTEMYLPLPAKKKTSHRASKRFSAMSSTTSQSTSTAPYTPVESIAESPAVAAFPVLQERYIRDRENQDFPIAGLSGSRRPKSLDAKAFLASRESA
ncbi:hypothetical protein BS17DRAFT_776837 [Gyrodon lividus]|nr:hypothetical protein BS17DRAFT_776837 [Gyrodon lividus]